MDRRLFSVLYKDAPQFNETVVEGFAVDQLRPENVMEYIDRIILCAQEQYPEGLEYAGSVRCTPIEEYNEITKAKSGISGSKKLFDLARSDVYLVKYNFKYHGEPLYPRYLYLPYVRPGGLIYISGKQWAVSPVLADKVFSVGMNDIFIPMPRGKVTFYRTLHHYIADDVRVSRYVVYSPLHNKSAKKTKTATSTTIHLNRVHTTMMHYLFCRYGFEETFRRFANTDVMVMDEADATTQRFPPEDWVICKSAKIKPLGVRLRHYGQIASNIALVIRRNDYTPLVESMVAGFYYVIDHFPDVMETEYVTVKDPWQWKVLLGYILWGDEPGQQKLVEDVDSHLKSLDGYVDFEVRRTLKEDGILCNNIYDLFVHIIENMPSMLIDAAGKVASMYDKQLMVLRYVLSDINNAIFEFLFEITSNNKKQMTKDSINKILGDHFKPKLIFRISSGKGHGEVSSVASPGDNKFFKITSVLIQQSDTAGKGKGRDSKPVDPTMFLDASIAEVGGYCVLPKSSPYGKSRINPYVKVDPVTGVIKRKEKFIELLDSVQRRVRRR